MNTDSAVLMYIGEYVVHFNLIISNHGLCYGRISYNYFVQTIIWDNL